MIYNYNRFVKLNENVQEWNGKLVDYSWRGNLNGVKECIENGADVNYISNDGWTPLMWSSYKSHLKIVKTLIENGAEVNCKNKNGDTPLIFSSRYGRLEIVKILIENGADWNIKNKDKDFMDFLSDKEKEMMIREYPEEYKEYLFKKDVEKYNL
jgi:ankyrin repeat protein